jgi:regulatory protein
VSAADDAGGYDAVPADDGRDRDAALDRAVRALARRDHSAASLKAKLDRAGVSQPAQAHALEVLERVGYVDDSRFARDRAAQLAQRGYGDEWIRADLEAQGVAPETASAGLAVLEPEGERAEHVAAKTGDGGRVVRLLARRGFSDETIERFLARDVARDGPEGVG